ncbi:hypothetical protein [Limosilactobacillus mucosae]|uniref:Uncharacterized protein n=1 Tax=Limosilactobacillus mucosae TaxID=97478 RepID=A0AAJ1HPZ3_LIMMU|nr:hypothetical protein [Limosilactobacillus mucosae]MDC2828511.1 hypothetical protein [Limosilactobacillus mucosae]MDC2834523.1 hypothetical protein [Limosilactobacillus mucosae]
MLRMMPVKGSKANTNDLRALNAQLAEILNKLKIGKINEMQLKAEIAKGIKAQEAYIDFLPTADIQENQNIYLELVDVLKKIDNEWSILSRNSFWHWNTIEDFASSVVQNVVTMKIMGVLTAFHYPTTHYRGGLRIALSDYDLIVDLQQNQGLKTKKEYVALHKQCQENYNQMAYWILQKYQSSFKDGWLLWNTINLNVIAECRVIYANNRKEYIYD